jgi:AraC-like DNA-binding protein
MREPSLEDVVSLSSDAYPAEDRFEMWREFFARNILRVEAATPDKSTFGAQARVQKLPAGLNLAHVEMAPCSLMRTKELLSDGYDGMYFSICLDGTGHWQSGSRSLTLERGQAALLPTWMLGGFRCDRSYRGLGIGLDREVVREFAASPEDLLLRPAGPGIEAVALLSAYCQHILRRSGAAVPGLGPLASRQIRELAAYALAPESELVRAAPFAGVKSARLRAVLDDIAAHLPDPGLSAETVASRLGLSARHVNRLMEGIGVSFSRYVRELRLDEARRRLGDVSARHVPIARIAYAVGFQDLSHFNREFRRRFGDTPSALRRQ